MGRRPIVLPELGLGQQPVRVCQWLIQRGSAVTQGEPLVELISGSAVIDLPAPATGILVRRDAGEDDQVKPGQSLGEIETE